MYKQCLSLEEPRLTVMKNTIKANETLGVIVHSAQNIKSPELELKATDHFQLQN